ncbi:hypothetical protein F5050DRAFT_1714089 [Lentinula boryana]|uniref:DUF6532 domain-containing protein n=1 Tax=Lentinula boryana TaxID=40481 RepID=A0ABQ8Q619_9AGAR|nr:hypothetical protein F5050DRAFT_1714089 [Lentinula boryana]
MHHGTLPRKWWCTLEYNLHLGLYPVSSEVRGWDRRNAVNKLIDAISIRLNKPYCYPAIITVLHKLLFKGAKSYGQHFINTFTSSSGTDDTKEIPSAMSTLVIVGIFAALKEWEEGKDQHEEQYFASTTFADIVGLHNALLIDKIRDAKVGNGAEKYHILMAHLYCDAKAGKGISVALNQVPDVDPEGMV